MSYFSVDIYTPDRVVVKDVQADSLIIPTIRGEINVLPEHTHIVTKLGTGIMTIKNSEGEEHFSITAGVLKVLKNKITVLSTTTERGREIDRERAEKARKLAEEKLSQKALNDRELVKYRRKLERAAMRMLLYEYYTK